MVYKLHDYFNHKLWNISVNLDLGSRSQTKLCLVKRSALTLCLCVRPGKLLNAQANIWSCLQDSEVCWDEIEQLKKKCHPLHRTKITLVCLYVAKALVPKQNQVEVMLNCCFECIGSHPMELSIQKWENILNVRENKVRYQKTTFAWVNLGLLLGLLSCSSALKMQRWADLL